MTAGPTAAPVSGSSVFGTDGIRARAGSYPLDRETVTRLGLRLAEGLPAGDRGRFVLLGGDTRESTPEICSWIAAGLDAGGVGCRSAGTLPTPGISHLTRALGAACGIAVSASHNPHTDNGIKLIDRDGGKWETEAESELERRLLTTAGRPLPPPQRLVPDDTLAPLYLDFLAGQLGGARPLAGLRVLLDCANGAASGWAADLFRRLGADAEAIFDDPDGRNINRGCGSTHPATLARRTAEGGFDLGFAFDGDADRVIWSDATGRVLDGDAILYLWATDLAERGELEPPAIVATTMSNLGLERALRARGIGMVRCPVGDRAVAETMRREGILLGGEQSGHVIHHGLSPTGDGLQTALHLAEHAVRSRSSAAELLEGFRRFPQVLLNVPVRSKPDLLAVAPVAAAARRAEEQLGDRGRLVLRYSGTEPLARVMIEGEDGREVETLAAGIAETIRRVLG
ncbi:MAG: phosphoglucosamine mutase [Thermoanaerobaculia bacterium]|nr:phosphoglucosamine mutase [Thermoanaerobaculia bacterium]